MKVYLCWILRPNEFRILVGAFESKERAEKWMNVVSKHNPEIAIQEIDVIMETPSDKEFEKISKHWKSLE